MSKSSLNWHEMTDEFNQNRFARNRLDEATSPYLLQHKDNPVHWQPWDDDAFGEAKRRNVPILLSIGYAACHWCHVMAHESFEDDEVAALMNDNFVCIKLDKEERPDLDEIYMTALSMMGEQGGWPLTMCLDGDAKPFWGGTYFPKTPQYGRPGFVQILSEIARLWRDDPDRIEKNATALSNGLKARATADARGDMPEDLPTRAAQTLGAHIDLTKGGLEGAPKFPQPFLYQFLWQHAQLNGDAGAREAVLVTLRKICQGGIYDHLRGGFARYSVDADWLVPHFEKMLYDNALIISLLTQSWRDTKEPLFAARISETIDWLHAEMCLPNGAFATSLDADTQGEEGKFYVWSLAEVEAALGDAAPTFCAVYDITAAGNFEGRNIPNLLAQDNAPQTELAALREKLLAVRNARARPARDDKILADWNAMMVTALCEAAQVFARSDWCDMAETAFLAARHTLTDAQNKLRHSARDGKVLDISLSTDYAFMGQAACALYQATGTPDYLAYAEHCADTLHTAFLDTQRGGYLSNPRDENDAHILVNNRPTQDNAMPSANAAIHTLFSNLAIVSGKPQYQAHAAELFHALSGHLTSQYPSMTALLASYQLGMHPLSIVIIGSETSATKELARTAQQHKIFARCIITIAPDDKSLPPTHPAFGKTQIGGQPTAYICLGHQCRAPITQSAALAAQLDALVIERQTIGKKENTA